MGNTKDFKKYQEEKEVSGLTGYNPDVVIHPGEFLFDALEEYNFTQKELSERIGLSKNFINELIAGKQNISIETAKKLSKVFDKYQVEYWLGLQRDFDLRKLQEKEEEELEKEFQVFQNFKETYKELSSLGILPKLILRKERYPEAIKNLQHFFRVDSLFYVNNIIPVAYRKYNRKNINEYSVLAWVKLAEDLAREREVEVFDKKRLQKMVKELKFLSTYKPEKYLPMIKEKLAEVGVAVVYLPKIKNTYIQGISGWLSNDKSFVALNTQKKDEGRFWFNLYHELGHILLHSKKGIFVDYDNDGGQTEIEKEADDFASRNLIEDFDKVMTELRFASNDLQSAVRNMAKKLKISPSILAGRLTHELKGYSSKIYPLLSDYLKSSINYSGDIDYLKVNKE